MKSEWKELSIDQLKSEKKNAIAMGPFGSRIKAENFVDVGIPVIKGGNLNGDFINEDKYDHLTEEKADELKTSNAFPLDIVITHRGTIGQVGLIPKNSQYSRYVVSQSQLKVTLDQNKMDPYYLYYFFKSKLGQHRLLMNASQVGVPAIAQASTSVKKILVPHPSIESQHKIVKILLALDDKIELNRKINQTLEAMAQALFKSWFVDFDPVHAKTDVKSEDELESVAVKLGIVKEVLDLFPSEFEESEMGMIPKGWSNDFLGSFVEILDSKRIPMSKNEREKKQGSIPYYGATSIMDYVDDFIFDEPLTLLGEDGSVVRDDGTPFMQYIWGKAWVNNHAHVIKSKSGLSTEAIYIALLKQNVTMFVTGAVQPKINQTNLKKIPMINPGDKLHRVYSELIAPMFAKIRQLSDETETLVKTRDILLPKLLSGEVEV